MKWILLLLLVFLVACAAEVEELPKAASEEEVEPVKPKTAWQDFELTDIEGKTFTISELEKPLLFETFAVWCPACKIQQDHGKAAHKLVEFTSVTVDIDPNEDEELVREYVEKFKFGGSYVIAPREFTEMLLDEFGFGIVSAPSVPVVLVCDDSYRFLKRGIKDADDLAEAVRSC